MNDFATVARYWARKELARNQTTRFGLANSGRTIDANYPLSQLVDPRDEDDDDACRKHKLLMGFIDDFGKSKRNRALIRARVTTGAAFSTIAQQFNVSEAAARNTMSRFYAYLAIRVRIVTNKSSSIR